MTLTFWQLYLRSPKIKKNPQIFLIHATRRPWGVTSVIKGFCVCKSAAQKCISVRNKSRPSRLSWRGLGPCSLRIMLTAPSGPFSTRVCVCARTFKNLGLSIHPPAIAPPAGRPHCPLRVWIYIDAQDTFIDVRARARSRICWNKANRTWVTLALVIMHIHFDKSIHSISVRNCTCGVRGT
jgi:hypothetical protein